jgi:hypothetical protein
MRLPDINELLQYRNPAVLKLYEQNYPHNKLSSEQAFVEVLKYLWLTRKHELDLANNVNNECFPQACIMLRSMREIDEMWHEFILFTQDYMDFCYTYFGGYMHHLPNIFDNMPRPRDEVEKDIEKLLPYIYDHLGEETLYTWFEPYLKDGE